MTNLASILGLDKILYAILVTKYTMTLNWLCENLHLCRTIGYFTFFIECFRYFHSFQRNQSNTPISPLLWLIFCMDVLFSLMCSLYVLTRKAASGYTKKVHLYLPLMLQAWRISVICLQVYNGWSPVASDECCAELRRDNRNSEQRDYRQFKAIKTAFWPFQ